MGPATIKMHTAAIKFLYERTLERLAQDTGRPLRRGDWLLVDHPAGRLMRRSAQRGELPVIANRFPRQIVEKATAPEDCSAT